MSTFRISEMVDRTGVPATTLRYYEKEHLLPAARTPAGYRTYTDADVDRVQFINAAKHLGLPLGRIRDLLEVWDGGRCREVRDELRPMIGTQITAADERIHDLQAFRHRLGAALAHLHELPAKEGPCEPACAFLDQVPRPDRLPLHDVAVACSLDPEHHADRVARWHEMLDSTSTQRTATGGIVVRLPADRAAELAGLLVAEQECCPFFTFRLTFAGTTVELTADAPDHAQPIVTELFGIPC